MRSIEAAFTIAPMYPLEQLNEKQIMQVTAHLILTGRFARSGLHQTLCSQRRVLTR